MYKRLWYIQDKVTKRKWSRNRLGTPHSTPDFYEKPHRAKYQLLNGKIRELTEAGVMQPELKECEIRTVE